MAPTFILTRSFAISGLLVGGTFGTISRALSFRPDCCARDIPAQMAYAAPMPYLGGCAMGCLIKEPDTPVSIPLSYISEDSLTQLIHTELGFLKPCCHPFALRYIRARCCGGQDGQDYGGYQPEAGNDAARNAGRS